MNKKRYLFSLICTLLFGAAIPCNAAIYDYSGEIVEASGAYSILFPVGTAINGFMVFSDAAVASGFVDENDLEDLIVQVGQFCIYLNTFNCTGTEAPLNIIDKVAIYFDSNGNVTGGRIEGAFFSPSDPYIPWLFNFDSNTMVSELTGVGFLIAETSLTPRVPLPGTIWLLLSAVFFVMGRHSMQDTVNSLRNSEWSTG